MGFTSFMNSATGGLYGDVKGAVGDVAGTVGSAGQSIINAVKDHPLEAAALGAAGWYFAPQISAWVSPAGETLAGTSAGTAAGAGAVELGTTSGAAWDAATMGAYGGPAAITAATGLTAAQMAMLAKAGVSLAGVMAAKNLAPMSSSGLLTQQQDRSGFSSGSANYSPEYYAAIQSKYNQYMPQQQGKDITTDLKNWYETKYTPQANVAAAPTSTTTGTGYTTPASLANLKMQPVPTYTLLSPSKSTETDVANEYAKYIAAAGGNTQANRDAAIQYLQKAGFSGSQIDAAYNKYLSTLPAATGTTAETMAANSTPAQIAQAYAGFVNANGGDTQANQAKAIQYLQQLGVPYATIEAAYPIFKSTYGQTSVAAPASPSGSSGMLTGSSLPSNGVITTVGNLAANNAVLPSNGVISTVGNAVASQPSYTSLTSASSPAAIAAAYRDFVAGSGGDTAANQAAAQNYLANLGVSPDVVNQAYGLFKG